MEPHRAMAEVIDSDPNPFAWKTIEKPTPYHQPVLDNPIRPSSCRQGIRPRGDAQPDGSAHHPRLGLGLHDHGFPLTDFLHGQFGTDPMPLGVWPVFRAWIKKAIFQRWSSNGGSRGNGRQKK